ncbi:MAG: phosphate-starvation-inducible PsiE family protein [Methylotenera sp.]|uniref:phosphate-starvation-inducible protein PsiE n=1 Tax=Methylotenera sp. TaxID=2051956 RepID=UPI002721FDCA|nr:phosphate-starvation-inducible PsiE family protein [Methylotenera sp.]MDO9394733.1 phosphate-starvation-inducible PsiE family protein [Methylotenera sp.]
MTPNKFSRLTQRGLAIVGQGVLIIIAIATIFAVFQAIMHIWQARAISIGDLLLLFLYLEVMSMLNHYLGTGNLPVRYPLYIGIIALARFLVLDIHELDAWRMFALSSSILLIALAILVVRYGHVRFPYNDDVDSHSKQ